MKKREKKHLIVAAISFLMLLLSSTAYSFEFEVEMDNFVFLPHGTRINVGDMITWRNRDVAQHSATSDNGVWDSGLLSRGQTFSYIFTTAGVYPYHCSSHTSMKDTIFVGSPTGIDETSPTPGNFELGQNYPNPFNSSTTIKYFLPEPSHTSLDIYNLLGQHIISLVNTVQDAGFHEINWNAATAPSGVYFVRLASDDHRETRKMILLK